MDQSHTPIKTTGMDKNEFRGWLQAIGLEEFEKQLPSESDLKQSDLIAVINDDGPFGLKAVLQEELGSMGVVKLLDITRLRSSLAGGAAQVRLHSSAITKTPASKTPSPFKTTDWTGMVVADRSAKKRPAERELTDELNAGNEYTYTENKTPHGQWFGESPAFACSTVEGLTFRTTTSAEVKRGSLKTAYVVHFSGELLSKIVALKRSSNSSYEPVSKKLVDAATFWGMIGTAFTKQKTTQLGIDKKLAKEHGPEAIRAICSLAVARSSAIFDEKISAEEKARTALESAAASGDLVATSRLKKKQAAILDIHRDKAQAQAKIEAMYATPIKLSEERETSVAAKKASRKRKSRALAAFGKGVNAKKRQVAADLDSDVDNTNQEDTGGRGGGNDDDDDDDDDGVGHVGQAQPAKIAAPSSPVALSPSPIAANAVELASSSSGASSSAVTSRAPQVQVGTVSAAFTGTEVHGDAASGPSTGRWASKFR